MIDIEVREDDGVPYPTRECVGCGYCCSETQCDASRRLYPGADHCPQLLWIEEDERYKCGLMLIAGPVGLGYKAELYVGAGCCSGLNSWRKDVKKRDRLDKDAYWNPLDQLFQIFLKCYANNFVGSDVMILTVGMMEKYLKETGYSEKEIKHIQTTILHQFRQNRMSFMEDFCG
jgi:hypothetical protein